ncbi:uncharacterized protein LOC123533324 [Mercenaria mercenaria]|uniref:uncharacterized protein LOC123533324 n=1 Tax=Mercenaria mercenaria TaxID=6596 RepID=UPI001E1D8FD0|nr:uncharacterized protein LOC123533324 [Mercenaria mercenaria]
MTSFLGTSVSTPVAVLPSKKSTPSPVVLTVEVVLPPLAVSRDEVVLPPPAVRSCSSYVEVVPPPPAVSSDEVVSPPPAVSSCSSYVEVVPPANTSQQDCSSVVSMSTVSQ